MKDLNIIYIYNLKNEIKDIKKDIIKDCLKTRKNSNYSFQIFTKHHKKLYSIFIKNCVLKHTLFNIRMVTLNKESWHLTVISQKHFGQNILCLMTLTISKLMSYTILLIQSPG